MSSRGLGLNFQASSARDDGRCRPKARHAIISQASGCEQTFLWQSLFRF